MSTIRYALLSLLARETLSGYDIKQQMNNRFGPFWKVGSNQVYPELAKMEGEGLVKLHGLEQHAYRPVRKVYEITEAGQEALKQWTREPGELDKVRDEFLLKTYNSWLVEPEKMIKQVEEVKKLHEVRLSVYSDKIKELNLMVTSSKSDDPIFSSIAIVEFGIQYERMYIKWCENLIEKL